MQLEYLQYNIRKPIQDQIYRNYTLKSLLCAREVGLMPQNASYLQRTVAPAPQAVVLQSSLIAPTLILSSPDPVPL